MAGLGPGSLGGAFPIDFLKETVTEMPFVGPGGLGGTFPIDFPKEIDKV